MALVEGADPGVIQMLSRRLQQWTGQVWGVSVSTRPLAPAPTIREINSEREAADVEAAKADPLVKAILEVFPGSNVKVVVQEEPTPPAAGPDVPDAAYEDAFSAEREDE